MRLEQNVVHRKVLAPWYDTETVCFLTIFLLFLCFLFSIAGVSVASERADYHGYVWVPLVLLFLSAGTMVSVAIRVVRRYVNRIQNRYLKNFSRKTLK